MSFILLWFDFVISLQIVNKKNTNNDLSLSYSTIDAINCIKTKIGILILKVISNTQVLSYKTKLKYNELKVWKKLPKWYVTSMD